MVTIPCPWCGAQEHLSLEDVRDPEVPFTCDACGTTVAIIEEGVASLDLAA